MKEIIIDVRSPLEFQMESAECSVNYPLNILQTKFEELREYDSIKVVCKSGARAENAKLMLEDAGFNNVESLGPWQMVNC